MSRKSKKWNPNYSKEFVRRGKILKVIKQNPVIASAYYHTRPVEFINDLCLTVDPRRSKDKSLTIIPFLLFQRQVDLINFIMQLIEKQSNGLIEKSRDMGATWCAVALSVWLWRFRTGVSIGFGSRKQMMVDHIGDMDSIFEKIRFTIRTLPKEMLPMGFSDKVHMNSMKIINPENGASITGEAGDNIGRGGRKLLYFLDESAWYERAKKIEAAIMDNTNVRIDMSSVSGPGTVFHNKRKAGVVWNGKIKKRNKTQVFILDWSDHPLKTRKWYEKRKQKAEDEGMLIEFAREIDRDYAAALAGTIIKRNWVEAAINLAEDMKIDLTGKRIAALDIADDSEDGDLNAFTMLNGMVLEHLETWGKVDTDITAKKAHNRCMFYRVAELYYDAIGVGAGVKGSLNSMKRDGDSKINVIAWMGSAKVKNPGNTVIRGDAKGPKNSEFFMNFKAQAWWNARNCFYNAWKCRNGKPYDPEMLISINRKKINKHELMMLSDELCQPIRTESRAGKMMIDKSPQGTQSPNRADSLIMAMFPAEKNELISKELLL